MSIIGEIHYVTFIFYGWINVKILSIERPKRDNVTVIVGIEPILHATRRTQRTIKAALDSFDSQRRPDRYKADAWRQHRSLGQHIVRYNRSQGMCEQNAWIFPKSAAHNSVYFCLN